MREPALPITPSFRVLLVNLPHPVRVQRRWVASYYAPNFLVPPIELMGLASLLRTRGTIVRLCDAIAEDLDGVAVARRYRDFGPDLVVGLTGFAILDQDLQELADLGRRLGATTAAFGYLPTRDAEDVAARPGIDYVIRGEPEWTLVELCEALESSGKVDDVAGLAFERDGGVVLTDERERIKDLDSLPFPDHRAVPIERYSESFLPGPIGVIMSARGCPFDCSFCVRTFGRRFVARSWQSLAEELTGLYRLNLRHVRFLDDTLTVDRDRILNLSRWIAENLPDLTWTCLTRLDRIDPELARAMAAGGCRRIYVGIESGDPTRLESYGKGLTVPSIEAGVAAARDAGIEVSGFFIIGAPGESEEDVRRSADLAIRLGLDFVIVTRLQRWPGTREEDCAPDELDDDRAFALERAFYRRFYLRPAWLKAKAPRILASPRDVALGARALLLYVAGRVAHRDFI